MLTGSTQLSINDAKCRTMSIVVVHDKFMETLCLLVTHRSQSLPISNNDLLILLLLILLITINWLLLVNSIWLLITSPWSCLVLLGVVGSLPQRWRPGCKLYRIKRNSHRVHIRRPAVRAVVTSHWPSLTTWSILSAIVKRSVGWSKNPRDWLEYTIICVVHDIVGLSMVRAARHPDKPDGHITAVQSMSVTARLHDSYQGLSTVVIVQLSLHYQETLLPCYCEWNCSHILTWYDLFVLASVWSFFGKQIMSELMTVWSHMMYLANIEQSGPR